MKITHADDGADTSTAIRGGARDFKTLLAGRDGTPDNYRAVLATQSGQVTVPRHRHNFDQIRMCLEGEAQNYGPDRWIKPGEVAYFPEGTAYGPEDSNVHRKGITFQFGGASGNGFISSQYTKRGMEELKAVGTFENGIFRRNGELTEGERRNQDSFEAIWEHVNKRKLEYPKPRYDEPILMRPENFSWHNQPGQPGYAIKRLGSFSERNTEISLLRIDAGASGKLAARAGVQLGFVIQGSGQADGEDVRLYSGFEAGAGESPVLTSLKGMQLLLVGLPIFAEQRMAAE